MLLQNNSRSTLAHGNIILKPKDIKDVDNEVAKIWLGINGVIEYIDPEEVKRAEAKAAEGLKKLKAENEALKAEIEKLKGAQGDAQEAEAKAAKTSKK